MKTDIDALQALFKVQEGPAITACDMENATAVVTLTVPEQLAWFDGHFPGNKVLPGVVQVDWAGKLAKALFVAKDRFYQLTNIKFKSMVMPGAVMQLTLSYSAAKQSITFSFFDQSETFSSGSFKFSAS